MSPCNTVKRTSKAPMSGHRSLCLEVNRTSVVSLQDVATWMVEICGKGWQAVQHSVPTCRKAENQWKWKPKKHQKPILFPSKKYPETAAVRLKLSSFTKLLSLTPTRPRSLGLLSTSHRKVRQKLHSASKVAMAALFEASGLIISTIIWLIRRGNTSKMAWRKKGRQNFNIAEHHGTSYYQVVPHKAVAEVSKIGNL